MPLVIYTLLRLGLFAVALVGLVLAGVGGWLAVLLAVVIAWAAAYLLLTRQRDDAVRWMAERSQRRKAAGVRFSRGVEDDARAEDAESAQASPAGAPAASEGQAEAEQDPVTELERRRPGQDGA